jgi:hypothetical protein
MGEEVSFFKQGRLRHRTIALIEKAGVNPNDVQEVGITPFTYRMKASPRRLDNNDEWVTERRYFPGLWGPVIWIVFWLEGGPR